ncbi:MAG: iron-containing alcohol dehydrogenase, partial [Eggerthellaceae bacterium]|nr:iron-containing alcohol dehydrogenase [Eggerthellaceae bacterium]
VAFQPFYKLSEDAMATWLAAVERFVEAGDVRVYAENAANTVFAQMGVTAFSYEDHFVEEVDTPEDLARVSAAIRRFDFAEQPVFAVEGAWVSLADGAPVGKVRGAKTVADVLAAFGVRRPFIVTSSFFPKLGIAKVLEGAGIPCETFTDFAPNPRYEDVRAALEAFEASGCDGLMSVGGGSAIDIAKCVKHELAIAEKTAGQELKTSPLPFAGAVHIAMPTTAGTGSESTHFAVCYVDGVKVSVANDCLVPDAVLLDASALAGLPVYQKKCTMLDALCQAIESHWSRRSCEESRRLSAAAIPAIMANAEAYLAGDAGAARAMLFAANRAGKAINLTTTTAPHALSYKLTSLYGLPHGHAVALSMAACWRVLLESAEGDLRARLAEIARLVCGRDDACPEEGLKAFDALFAGLDMRATVEAVPGDLDRLVASVNLQRLSNFPVELTQAQIRAIYEGIVAC